MRLIRVGARLGGVLLGVLGGLAGWRAWEARDDAALERALAHAPPGDRFEAAMIAGLPEPARRYFAHAIALDTPLADTVRLTMHGTIRLGADQPWWPMRAHEVLAPHRGFVWRARVGDGLRTVVGGDRYAAGRGGLRFWLWGVLPVARAGGGAAGRDVARSAIGRMAAEAIWAPGALLPARGVRWEARGPHEAVAHFDVDGEPIALTLVLRPDGAVRRVTLPRWGDPTGDGRHGYVPFGAEVVAERRFGGYTIPSELAAGWWVGTDRYFEFFRATIGAATFGAAAAGGQG